MLSIYGENEEVFIRMTYNGKCYQIDDGSDYLLNQIHIILRNGGKVWK